MANARFGVNILPKNNTETLGNSDHPWTIVSPALTGTPTAPTAADGTKTGQIATTEFVQNAKEGMLDDIVAPEYDSTATYEVGEYCTHDGDLYKCNTAIDVAEDWTAAHWDKISITEELGKVTGYTNITSGTIATFPDGADGLPMTVTAEITPVQDLHGYDSPWPAGGGKNLLPITVSSIKNSNSGTWNDNSITINGITFTILTDSAGNVNGIKCQGTASANTYLNLFDGTISLSAGDYASLISGSAVGVSLQLRIGSVSGSDLMGSATTSSKTTNIESVTSIIGRLSISNGTALTTAVSVYPMLAQQSTALTINDYAPYSNVCPISGRDSVQITGTGKNLLNPNASKTVVTASGDRIGIEISTPGTYTMRNNALYSSSGSLYTTIVTNGVPASANRFVINSTSSSTYQIANGQKLLIHGGSGVTAETLADYITTAKIQLEQGSTASAYESFGQTYPVTFPSTVYGGTVKVNKDGSGKLVIGYGIATENTFTGNVQSGSAMGHYVSQDDTGAKLNAHAITNIVPVDNANAWNDNFPVAQVGISVEGRLRIYGSFTTLEEFKQQFAGLQFVYELATPVEIDLTDSDAIVSLLGVNNVWADCGDIKVEYMTDSGIASYIKMKADKVSGATDGDFASLDANGNLKDSGKKVSDFALASEAVTSIDYDTTNKKITKTVNGQASDVVSVSTIKNDLGKFTWGQLAGKSDPT